ncbi:hypothetical protein M427DRAFT_338268 [Gonapodya prolifera JEL478]|uniref:Uncharacterized protein n=1 Tax=Gonapodya prolifera (strain JEL478) TaxID=1344416 RepID=A0A139AD53_GONPJ|nr:hypothetical protein M427DRAFT_338268 [Gonapodya prolifera JEL478]|eukprot:KXS14514.1 hypothetical protein M427DRAFT_338268 [Gonapodya prolifera JEL478]
MSGLLKNYHFVRLLVAAGAVVPRYVIQVVRQSQMPRPRGRTIEDSLRRHDAVEIGEVSETVEAFLNAEGLKLYKEELSLRGNDMCAFLQLIAPPDVNVHYAGNGYQSSLWFRHQQQVRITARLNSVKMLDLTERFVFMP